MASNLKCRCSTDWAAISEDVRLNLCLLGSRWGLASEQWSLLLVTSEYGGEKVEKHILAKLDEQGWMNHPSKNSATTNSINHCPCRKVLDLALKWIEANYGCRSTCSGALKWIEEANYGCRSTCSGPYSVWFTNACLCAIEKLPSPPANLKLLATDSPFRKRWCYCCNLSHRMLQFSSFGMVAAVDHMFKRKKHGHKLNSQILS